MKKKAVIRTMIATAVDGLMVETSWFGSVPVVGLCWANAGRVRRRMRRVVVIGF